MLKLFISVLVMLVWSNPGIAQNASSFTPPVNSSMFNSSIIQSRGYSKAIVQGAYYSLGDGEMTNLFAQHFYFDSLGKVVYCQIYDGDALIQCMDTKELRLHETHEANYLVDTTYFDVAWAHVEEAKETGHLNCATLTLNGRIKQVLYEDSLPILVDMLLKPLSERSLYTRWITYYSDEVHPLNCISTRQVELNKIKDQQSLQDSVLLSGTLWPTCFASGERYKRLLIDTNYLKQLTSLWDMIECGWLTKENYNIVGFEVRGMKKEVAATYRRNSDILGPELVIRLSKWDWYSIYGIIVQNKRTGERLELGGFTKYMRLE